MDRNRFDPADLAQHQIIVWMQDFLDSYIPDEGVTGRSPEELDIGNAHQEIKFASSLMESCEHSYDDASPVEKKESDGSCNLHKVCTWTHHALRDVIPGALEPFGKSIGEQQMTCHEICETQPLPLRGFCLAGNSPMGMGPT